jgi:Domain of unknown function DUF11
MINRIRRIFSGFGLLAVLIFISTAAPAMAQTVTVTSAGPITFTNGVAAAVPYPSLIYAGTNGAASLPGTIQTIYVTLNNFSCKFLEDASVMVEAPNGTALEIMSGAGGTATFSTGILTISDSAASLMPTSAFGPGTYKPTVYLCGDTFPSPAPTGYRAAATCGTSTFLSQFNGLNPNGIWRLFLANQSLGTSGSADSWSLAFTLNPPDLSVTCSHTGNFYRGETGAQYFLVVSNAGPGFSGGSLPVTVVDTLPAGLTPIAASGTGWNCVIVNQTVSCTETNLTAAGTSFPTITLTVNVSLDAPASVVNAGQLFDSGNGTQTFKDYTTVNPPPTTLIDANFNTNSSAISGNGPTFGPAMSGAAVLGIVGELWNEINVSSGTNIPLIYADGSSSPVTMTFVSAGGYNVFSYGGTTPFVSTSYEPLMENYLYNGGVPRTIMLSGLAANSMYKLVLYNAADSAGADRTTYFTVNSNTLSSTWNGASDTLIAGTDYVEFASALSDGSGNLAITWTGNGTAEGDINGFQIQITPAPQLGISLAGPDSVRIFWPSTGNFVLQTNKNVASTNWGNFSGSITTSNGTNSITVTPPAGNVFFRLKQ